MTHKHAQETKKRTLVFENIELTDVIDAPVLQELMNDYYALTGIGIGIIDIKGNVLVGTGWQDICVKFHRAHPESCTNCHESNIALASGVVPGTFKEYRCKNNMWDIATPIMLGDRHIGNIFLGQFLYDDEELDYQLFRLQAQRFGYDETAYIAALDRVPRFSRETVQTAMNYYTKLAQMISKANYSNIAREQTLQWRKQAEDAQRKTEEDLLLATQATNIGIWDWDLIQDILSWNDNMCTLYGIRREDFSGIESWSRALHPDDRDYAEGEVQAAFRGEREYAPEFRIIHSDGTIRYLKASSRTFFDENDKPIRMIGTNYDITELKQKEKTLRQQHSFLRQIIDMVPAIICVKTLEGPYALANKTLADAYGTTVEMLEGRKDTDFSPTEEESKAFRGDDLKVIVGRETLHIAEEKITYADGSTHWLTTTKIPLSESDGSCSKLLAVAMDITERKLAQEEKAILESQLCQAQKMESVGRLAGGVAHDFNNMLGVILGYAELSLIKLDQSHPLLKTLMIIRETALRSADLTQQLLAFARKQTIAPKVLDLNENVTSMLKMLERLIGEDIDLVWVPAADLWPIKMDPSQIDQFLTNLCVNARDAIFDVGKVTIETENNIFDENYCAIHAGFLPGDYVQLAVSDNGIGMDKETTAHIFEPFFTTKNVGKGTGLGLAMVYGIVKQNNGFINVCSEPGEGTTFRIYLPRHLGKTELAQRDGAVVPAMRGNETILLVEDEQYLREMITMMLEGLGYTVLPAGNSGEAFRLADAHAGKIQLLMTDVVMPVMNGRELANEMIALHSELKCLFMSGYTANVIAHHGVLEEGVHFIPKPFSLDALATKVREAL